VKQPKVDMEARRKRAVKRGQAVRELLETEKTYVNRMEMCIMYLIDPLAEQKKLISENDHQILFSDYKIIFSLNSQFLLDLTNAIQADALGKQFEKFCPYFRMYQNYLNNYDRAIVCLTKLQTKQAFNDFCNEQRVNCNGQQLQSFLILPIQRLPRYKLCLTEIVKNTERDHRDLELLRLSLKLVGETTLLINERMKEFEARQQVRAIEARFNHRIALVQPSRSFVKEGMFVKVDKSGKDQEYTFILFNDMLCYASGNPDSLKMHTELPIDQAFFVQDVPNHPKYDDRSFEIHSSVKSFVAHCSDYSLKRSWMSSLQKIISQRVQLQVGKTQQRELAAPLMVPDDWSQKCMLKECGKNFTTFNRRHHCRYCGKLVCGKCGKYKLANKLNSGKVVKPVCKKCFDTYNGTFAAPVNVLPDEDSSNSDDDDRKTDD
jgi:FYVE/RhoGEF/PH domain-containing protein 5/6